jgi:hypothetical protein
MPTVRDLISEYEVDGNTVCGMTVKWENDFYLIDRICNDNIELVSLNNDLSPIILRGTEIVELEYPPQSKLTATKTPFHLLDLGFCAAMCRNWEAGIKDGRKANDWETLPQTNETRERYAAKIMRHLHEYVEQRGVAAEHLAAIACNANILWHIAGRGE